MNKLYAMFEESPAGGLFMAHMIAGFPSMRESEKIAKSLVAGGADIIEMQIPFSDPMADGPTIAVACDETLARGMTVKESLAVLARITKLGKPVVVMTYMNPVFMYGIAKFVGKIRSAGATALIVPDCPYDTPEGQELLAACEKHEVALIPVVSPGVPKERLEKIAENARGFVYCTSRQGITGTNSSFAKRLEEFVQELKEIFKLPIAIGFGVKSPSDVVALKEYADIVIAGSVFVHSARKGGAKSVEKTMLEFKKRL